MTRGRFITFEGGEGAGKSTVLAAASARLRDRGIPLVCTREPGGTPFAETLRAAMLDPQYQGLSPDAEVLTVFAARADHVHRLIEPALARGDWVVSDRYTDASYAYQGAGRGIPTGRIAELESWAACGLKPDCTILLDLPVGAGLARARGRGPSDRMESEDEHFFERVRACYLARARAEPGRFRVIDATAPVETVRAEVEALIDERIAAWWVPAR